MDQLDSMGPMPTNTENASEMLVPPLPPETVLVQLPSDTFW